jgi:hypothetical protein
MRWTLVLLLALALPDTPASALVLDDENRLTLVLGGGVNVTLIGEATDSPSRKTRNYYYLPSGPHLRLARRADGTPEFLFLKYTTDKTAGQGGISGGLMHFLMEWGLTPEQEADMKAKLTAKVPGAQLMGAVPLEPEGETGSFQIISATLSDRTLAPTVVLAGTAPPLPNSRTAAASRLTAEGAQLLAATLEKSRSISDVSVSLNYRYTTLMPAVRGTITLDWSRLEEQKDSLRIKYTKKSGGCFMWWCGAPTYTYDEVKEQVRFLEDNKIIEWHMDELIADERTAKVREAFLQYLLNMTTEPPKPETPPPPPSADEKAKDPDVKHGRSYTFSQSSMKRTLARKKETVNMNLRLAVKWPHQLVGNMMSFYDAARDNPRCVNTVTLNDPFFQHREIPVMLNLERPEIFDEALNYVTVNVRKRRSTGNTFEDRVTFDAKTVKEKGVAATVTYARGDDRSPDVFEYQTVWSVKGGGVYPANAPWSRGTSQGIDLSPPIEPRKIDVEGDLDAMAASGVTRVTAQVHYPRLGREVEVNIPISPAGKEPLVTRWIYTDRDTRRLAYRLVVNHKTEGTLALPWRPVDGEYIYAQIPPELLTEPQMKEDAKAAAKGVGTSAEEKVLQDLFKDAPGGGAR